MAPAKVRLGTAVRGCYRQLSRCLRPRQHRLVDIGGFVLLALAFAAVLLRAPLAAAAEKVGVAAAVNPSVTGKSAGAESRIIQVGVAMHADERVVTTTTGQTQLLFLDGSALTIGPSSEVTIDRFAFDPDSNTGTLVMSAAKGIFRLVGGKISKGTPVEFKTPSATIGIRGGIAVVTVAPGQPLLAQFLYGREMTVSAGGQQQTATSAGSAIVVPLAAPGVAPTPLQPRPTTTSELLNALAQLENQNAASSAFAEPTVASGVAASMSDVGRRGTGAAVQIGNAAAGGRLTAPADNPAPAPIGFQSFPAGISTPLGTGSSGFSFGAFAGEVSPAANLFEYSRTFVDSENSGQAGLFASTVGFGSPFSLPGLAAQQLTMPYGRSVPIGDISLFHSVYELEPSHVLPR